MNRQNKLLLSPYQTNYKYGINADHKRKLRHDELLNIRKNNRIDKLSKQRHSDISEYVSTNYDDFKNKISRLYSNHFDDVLNTTVYIRKFLESSDRIRPIIDSGIIPKLVELCKAVNYPNLQYEAIWALTNVVAGSTEETKVVIDAGAIPILVKLMESQNTSVIEQSIWALGNIAADNVNFRNSILEHGALIPIINTINQSTTVSLLRIGSWTLSKLVYNLTVNAEYKIVILKCLAKLTATNHKDVVSNACWGISYINDINAIIELGIIEQLIFWISSDMTSIQIPALRIIGNIACGDTTQTGTIIRAGIIQMLHRLMNYENAAVRKEVFWILSNIAADSPEYIQIMINVGCLPPLFDALQNDCWDIKREAMYAVANFCSCGTKNQVLLLKLHIAIKPICDILSCNDITMIIVALNTIECILAKDRTFVNIIEDVNGIDKLEALQNNQNQEVYNKTMEILNKFIGFDEEYLVDQKI